MSLSDDILPVTLVTGFLGSGKSTLLADVLHGEAAQTTAVLVNEFGAVGLDHLLVGEVNAQTVLLDNGCVCCSIRGELRDALATLFSQRSRGELPPFSRVVIETTGLATPAPIIATLLADPVVRNHYALNATITVVDAVNAMSQSARHPEWLAQVAAADRLLISKADLADEAGVAALADRLAMLNPAASVIVRDREDSAGLLDRLFASASTHDLMRRLGNATEGLSRSVAPPSAHGGDDDRYRPWSNAARSPLTHRSATQPDINAFCIQIDEPLDWQVFTLWFTMLLNRHGDKILRVKGLLCIEGSNQPAVLHAVQHLVHPVLHLDAWPDGKMHSRLVFITEGLASERVEASYMRFRQHLEEAVH
ncbi:GTP-binding protein [Paraburkholderia sp.]|jgi:G3E family GTPase|uniref:CobW family GTP-binding protein n=1 Tax=Paraburkholderia sp. TaxID=1926495 RepID=UPI002F3FF6F4